MAIRGAQRCGQLLCSTLLFFFKLGWGQLEVLKEWRERNLNFPEWRLTFLGVVWVSFSFAQDRALDA